MCRGEGGSTVPFVFETDVGKVRFNLFLDIFVIIQQNIINLFSQLLYLILVPKIPSLHMKHTPSCLSFFITISGKILYSSESESQNCTLKLSIFIFFQSHFLFIHPVYFCTEYGYSGVCITVKFCKKTGKRRYKYFTNLVHFFSFM